MAHTYQARLPITAAPTAPVPLTLLRYKVVPNFRPFPFVARPEWTHEDGCDRLEVQPPLAPKRPKSSIPSALTSLAASLPTGCCLSDPSHPYPSRRPRAPFPPALSPRPSHPPPPPHPLPDTQLACATAALQPPSPVPCLLRRCLWRATPLSSKVCRMCLFRFSSLQMSAVAVAPIRLARFRQRGNTDSSSGRHRL